MLLFIIPILKHNHLSLSDDTSTHLRYETHLYSLQTLPLRLVGVACLLLLDFLVVVFLLVD